MRAKIIKIGNSRGIRIPHLLLKESGLKSEVEIKLSRDGLNIRPIKESLPETTVLSEKSLAQDWNNPGEDKAWKSLWSDK